MADEASGEAENRDPGTPGDDPGEALLDACQSYLASLGIVLWGNHEIQTAKGRRVAAVWLAQQIEGVSKELFDVLERAGKIRVAAPAATPPPQLDSRFGPNERTTAFSAGWAWRMSGAGLGGRSSLPPQNMDDWLEGYHAAEASLVESPGEAPPRERSEPDDVGSGSTAARPGTTSPRRRWAAEFGVEVDDDEDVAAAYMAGWASRMHAATAPRRAETFGTYRCHWDRGWRDAAAALEEAP